MSNIIIPGQAGSQMEQHVPFATAGEMDNYEDDPDYADAFEPALWLLLHKHDITMDPTMSMDDQLNKRDIGLLSHSFWKWAIYVNWQTVWAQKIPPHHMAVHFNNTLVGIISPFLTARTCWSCRLGDPTRKANGQPADGGFDENLMFMTLPLTQQIMHPTWPKRLPLCYPAHPCPRCKNYDWFASTVRIEAFQRDAAEHLAVETGEDDFATEMRMTHDVLGRDGQMGYARTKV